MILKRLQHQNIINLIEIVTSKPSDKNKNRGNVYLVFEYMEHDLQGLGDIKINFNLSHIKCILHQVLTGINYIHSNNIIHRDIKGANILINNKGEVKIADFGLARQHNPSPHVNKQYTNRVVTLWYRSPELLLGSTNYGPSVDIWSVGCLFSELLTGVAPFRANKEQEQIEKIFEKCGSPTEETWPGVTKLKLFNSLAPKLQYPYTLRTYYSENKK
jgi:cyclin-dependent kinase 12/13